MKTINQNKIRENMLALGVQAPVGIKTMDHRGYVRSFLNGLGVTSEQYIPLTMGQLEGIYNELIQGNGQSLSGLFGADAGERAHIVYEVDQIKMALLSGVQAPVHVPTEKAVIQKPKSEDKANKLAQAIYDLMSGAVTPLDESRVVELIKEHGSTVDESTLELMVRKYARATSIEIKTGDIVREVKTGLHHKILPDMIKALATGVNIMLVGPAGSGKTTMAHQAAEALGVPFYFNGAISSEYKLTGFIDAQGRIVSTAFRKAYETGGLYLFDEIDASMPDALLAFNAALANGHMDFPDGTVKRHADFYCVAAANTFGKGADRVYVGRNSLDAASLDRFIVLCVDYDEELEMALAGNEAWTRKVQGIRKAVQEHKIRHVVSPRASINGAKMLAAGFSEADTLEMVLFKGLDTDAKRKIAA